MSINSWKMVYRLSREVNCSTINAASVSGNVHSLQML